MPRPPDARTIRQLITERETSRGLLIAFEGPDGSGKTTQRKLLKRWLESQNHQVVSSRWASSALVKPMLKARKTIRALSIEEYSLLHAVDFRHRIETSTCPHCGRNISMRTLALVYAADLAFRLRWEIRPVLDAGGMVVASPYIETAVAFGCSCGLSEDWSRQLMRFAPAPDVRGRVDERKVDRPWKRRSDRGYPEYCVMMLDASAPRTVANRARHEMMRMLDQVRGRKVFTLTNKGIEAIAEAASGNRPDAPRRSASRPRIGRK